MSTCCEIQIVISVAGGELDQSIPNQALGRLRLKAIDDDRSQFKSEAVQLGDGIDLVSGFWLLNLQDRKRRKVVLETAPPQVVAARAGAAARYPAQQVPARPAAVGHRRNCKWALRFWLVLACRIRSHRWALGFLLLRLEKRACGLPRSVSLDRVDGWAAGTRCLHFLTWCRHAMSGPNSTREQ